MKKIIAMLLGVIMCFGTLVPVSANGLEFTREMKTIQGEDTERNYCVITALRDGAPLWRYTTEARVSTELESFSEIYQNGENAYFTAHGTLYALDLGNGQLKWSAGGVGGSNCFAFDKYGNVYVSGYYGPNVVAFDKNGAQLYKDTDGSYCWVDSLTISGDVLNIHYGLDDLGNDDGTKALDLTQFYPRENEISVVLDGEKILFDQPPVSVDGRTLVPIRAVIEEMGGTVEWNPHSSASILEMDGNKMTLILGSKTAFYNGEEYELDVEPQAINNRTLLPLRFVAEKFGFSVGWDGDTRTVIIETK